MRIIGVDPGTIVAGYGIVDVSSNAGGAGAKIKAVAAGAWKLNTNKKEQLPLRLATLAIELRKILEIYKPTHLCLELSFLAKNARTALILGHARGVILSEAHQYGLVITEISATSAKKMISGNGRADKSDVAKIIQTLLGITTKKLPLDATDALSIAYADAMRYKTNELFSYSHII